MDAKTWNELLEKQLDKARQTLGVKAEEYATDDRLHNFKVAAELQGITPRAALAGMMAKHTVSVYDILHADTLASNAMVQEKLGDNLNYLLLAFAVIQDERDSQVVSDSTEPETPNDIQRRIDKFLETLHYSLKNNGDGTFDVKSYSGQTRRFDSLRKVLDFLAEEIIDLRSN